MKTSQKFIVIYMIVLLAIVALFSFGDQISRYIFPSLVTPTLNSSILITKTLVIEPPTPSRTPLITETAIPTETASVSKVTLTGLQDGQTVDCLTELSGTYPLDVEYIWPVIFVAGRFYPQDYGGKAAQKIDGSWYQIVRFGNCDNPNPDVGLTFELYIFTANNSANAEFEAYIANAVDTGNWEGMASLPSGIEEQVHISVIRK